MSISIYYQHHQKISLPHMLLLLIFFTSIHVCNTLRAEKKNPSNTQKIKRLENKECSKKNSHIQTNYTNYSEECTPWWKDKIAKKILDSYCSSDPEDKCYSNPPYNDDVASKPIEMSNKKFKSKDSIDQFIEKESKSEDDTRKNNEDVCRIAYQRNYDQYNSTCGKSETLHDNKLHAVNLKSPPFNAIPKEKLSANSINSTESCDNSSLLPPVLSANKLEDFDLSTDEIKECYKLLISLIGQKNQIVSDLLNFDVYNSKSNHLFDLITSENSCSVKIRMTKFFFSKDKYFIKEFRKILIELLLFSIDFQTNYLLEFDYIQQPAFLYLYNHLLSLYGILITNNIASLYTKKGVSLTKALGYHPSLKIIEELLYPEQFLYTDNSTIKRFIYDLNKNSLQYKYLERGFDSFFISINLEGKK